MSASIAIGRRRRSQRSASSRFSLERYAPRAARGDDDARAIVAGRLLPRLAKLWTGLGGDDERRSDAAAAALERTLTRMQDDPSGELSHAGSDGWTALPTAGLAVLEILRELGRDVDVFARPRLPLGDRAVVALHEIEALGFEVIARILDADVDDVNRAYRRAVDHLGMRPLGGSGCPAWSSVSKGHRPELALFASQHTQRCDPCKTFAALHTSRRRELIAMDGLATFEGVGTAWEADPDRAAA